MRPGGWWCRWCRRPCRDGACSVVGAWSRQSRNCIREAGLPVLAACALVPGLRWHRVAYRAQAKMEARRKKTQAWCRQDGAYRRARKSHGERLWYLLGRACRTQWSARGGLWVHRPVERRRSRRGQGRRRCAIRPIGDRRGRRGGGWRCYGLRVQCLRLRCLSS